MQKVLYASIVGSLMYAHGHMLPDLAFIFGMFNRYLSNIRMDNWKVIP